MAGVMKLIMCTTLIAAALIAAVAPPCEAAIGCDQVISYVHPCFPYVTGKGPLAERCCVGIRSLYGAAKTTPDKRSVCNCLKARARSFRGINYGKVAGLPGKCRVRIPYQISPSTDCSKVN